MRTSLYRKRRIVLGFATLRGDILRDNLFGDVPACADEVPSGEKGATPELLIQTSVFRHQVVGGLTLHRLHQATRRYVRRRANEKIYVVHSHGAPKDLDIVSFADFADQFPRSFANFSPKDRPTVLRCKDKVVMEFVNGVRCSTVLPHAGQRTAGPLKAPPKGGGFHPPRMGQ